MTFPTLTIDYHLDTDTVPTCTTTDPPDEITPTTALISGEITDDGGQPILAGASGMVGSTTANPDPEGNAEFLTTD